MQFPSFESGSLSKFVLAGTATLTLAVYSFSGDPKNVSFLLVFFGLHATLRQYQGWRRSLARRLPTVVSTHDC